MKNFTYIIISILLFNCIGFGQQSDDTNLGAQKFRNESFSLEKHEVFYIVNHALENILDHSKWSLRPRITEPTYYYRFFEKSIVKFAWNNRAKNELLTEYLKKRDSFTYKQIIDIEPYLSEYNPIQSVAFYRVTNENQYKWGYIPEDFMAYIQFSDIYIDEQSLYILVNVASRNLDGDSERADILLVKYIICPSNELILDQIISYASMSFLEYKKVIPIQLKINHHGCDNEWENSPRGQK